MIQAHHIGQIAHELETIYEKLINQQIQVTPQLIALIRLVQDDIADRIQTIRDQQIDYPSTHVVQLLQQADHSADLVVSEPATEITALSDQDESSGLEVLQLGEEEVSEEPSLAADELSGNDIEEQVEDTSSLQTVENSEHALEDDVR